MEPCFAFSPSPCFTCWLAGSTSRTPGSRVSISYSKAFLTSNSTVWTTYTEHADEQVVKASFGDRVRFRKNAHLQPKHTKSATHSSHAFSGHAGAFFGFLALSSSFWPDYRPISPNLGPFWGILTFWSAFVPFSISPRAPFSSTYGIFMVRNLDTSRVRREVDSASSRR